MAEAVDLYDLIDKNKSSILNNVPKTSIEDVINGGSIRSDSDEQLLITIAFHEAVKLQAIALRCTEMKLEDCSGPAKVKLFINKPSMDFDDAENLNEAQEIDFSADDINMGSQVATDFVKFQNVSTLTVFIESNQEETDQTLFNKLSLIGLPRKGMNVNELKKVG